MDDGDAQRRRAAQAAAPLASRPAAVDTSRVTTTQVPARPTHAPTDPPGRLVSTDAGPVHVVEEGPLRGPAALLVHGLPGSVRDWRYLAPLLAARGVRSVRVDLPGFGGTPASTGPATTRVGAARLVAGVASALGLDRFALAGHSFGGAISLAAAARMPERVAALALVNAPGPVRHRGYMAPSAAHAATAMALRAPLVGPRVAPLVKRAWAAAGFTRDVPNERERLAAVSALVASLDFRAIRRELAALRCPVLVASSDDDPLVESFVARATMRAISADAMRTHLHRKTGGHYLQKHAADDVAEWIALRLRGGGADRAA